MTPACSLRLPAAKAAKAETVKFRGRGGTEVRRYENRLSAEFSAERVISRLQPRERLTPAPPYHRKKNEKSYEKATHHRVGGEGDSSRAHGIPDGDWNHLVYGLWTVLKITPDSDVSQGRFSPSPPATVS